MRRILSRSALVLAAVLMMLVPTAPSIHAGNGYWSQSYCRPDVWVWDEPGRAFFWTTWTSTQNITGHALTMYWWASRECGWMGTIIDSGKWYNDGYGWYWAQYTQWGAILYDYNTNQWRFCDRRQGPAYCWVS